MLTMHLIKEDVKSYCGTALPVLQFRHSPNQYLKKTKQKTNTIDITAGWQKERQHQPQQQPGLQTPSSQK